MRISTFVRGILRSALFTVAVVALTAISASSAQGATVFNETFDPYTNGDLLGQGGWGLTGTSVVNPIQVVGAADKEASLTTTGQDLFKGFTDSIPHLDGNTLTTSAAINVSAAQATGDYFLHLSDPVGTTTNFYQRLYARSATGGYVLGIAGSSGTPTYGTTVLPFSQEQDVDIDWTFVPGATNDTFTITVNSLPYLAYAWDNLAAAEPAATISAANLRQGTTANAPTLTIDDIVVNGVVPEPASLSVLAIGALLGLRRRR